MKRLIEYLSFNGIKKDVRELNGNLSMKNFIIVTCMWGAGIYGMCLLYRMNWYVSGLVMIAAIMMVPGLVRNYFKELYEMRRFADVDIYLHQTAYSFMRTPKVNMALKDAQMISTGKLRKCIDKAVDELEYGMSEQVYASALGIIEDEYQCARIKTLHRFIINVEERGGNYKGALEVLIEDFDRWVSNTYKYQKEIKGIKRDISIGIAISMILAAMTTFMCNMLDMFSDHSISISDTPAYQIAAAVFVLLCIGFYVFTRRKYGVSWLEKSREDKQIMSDYKKAFGKEAMHITIKLIPLWSIILLAAIICLLVRNIIAAVSIAACLIVLVAYPFAGKKSALRRARSDLYEGFTEWLRDLAVSLENKPLLSAIEDTYNTCPVIMKKSLDGFIRQIEDNPSDVLPYYSFLKEFNVVDIQAAVRILYSIGELDQDNISETIDVLVRRNNQISDKAEQARYRDVTSVMRFSEYLPTFFVAFKMAVDMMLVVTMYL